VRARLPVWLASELSAHQKDQRAGGTVPEVVRAALSQESLSRLERTALVLLRPDALESGRGAEVLDVLQAEFGAKVLDVRVTRMTPSDFSRFYRHELACFGHLVWLNLNLFAAGPAALVLLDGAPDGYASFSARLNAHKGDSSPVSVHQEGSLRTRVGRQSTIHMGIHVADDPGAVLCQATLLLTPTRLRAALDRVDGLDRAIWASLLQTTSPPAATVFEALLQTIRRILASLAVRGFPDEVENLARIVDEAEAAAGRKTLDLQRRQFPVFAAAARRPLELMIDSVERSCKNQLFDGPDLKDLSLHYEVRLLWARDLCDLVTVAYAAWYLSGQEPYGGDAGDALFDSLERADVPLVDASRLLLATALQYDVNPAGTYNGRTIFRRVPT